MAERLTEENFDTFVKESKIPVLVDFYKDGCAPCRRISPLLSQAAEEYDGRIAFARVNTTQNQNLVSSYKIQAAPTLILFQNGTEEKRHRGVIKKDELKTMLDTAL